MTQAETSHTHADAATSVGIVVAAAAEPKGPSLVGTKPQAQSLSMLLPGVQPVAGARDAADSGRGQSAGAKRHAQGRARAGRSDGY